MRRNILTVARLLLVSTLAIAWFAPGANAEEAVTLQVSEPTDFYFTFEQESVVQARAYGQHLGYDTYLWLYNSEDLIVAENDDWFGLDSWLDVSVSAGTYRLRAGVCCGDPEAWRYWAEDTGYTISFNVSPIIPTPETTTTTEVPETTTTSTTSTTSTTTTTTTTSTTTTTTTVAPTTTIYIPPPIYVPPPMEVPTWPPTTESTPPTTTITTTAPETTVPATTVPTSIETSIPSSPPSTPSPEPAATNAVTQAPVTVPTVIPPAESVLPEQPPVITPPETTTTTTTTVVTGSATPTFDTAPPADAPLEVRKEFENSVDLFSGAFDDYVPIGSTITVAQRRVVVAATAVMFLLPAPSPRRRI